MLLGIAGLAGSGKDTVANMLVERFAFTKVSLADPLKRICKDVFDFTDEQLWGPSEHRNAPDARWDGLTPRYALQQLGTEWGRRMHPDVWVRYMIRSAQAQKADVVTADVRFPNELEAIHAAGGKVWKIIRPNAGLEGEAATHSSETALDGYDAKFDAIIFNDASLGDLEDAVCKIARVTL